VQSGKNEEKNGEIERKKEIYQVGFLRRRRSERSNEGFPGKSEAFEGRSLL
jgi:hypothetical protein